MQNKTWLFSPLPSTTGFLFSAIAVIALSSSAQASNLVLNGSFEDVGSASASFSVNNPTVLPDWAASPSGSKILDCLVLSGATTDLCGSAFGGGFQFWTDPGASPDGGNFFMADGDSDFSTPLTQAISGLVSGQQYQVTFYQAAAQQSGFDGVTTERWQVSLDGDSQLSTLMNNANHGAVSWMSQVMTFTATAATQTLSFMAVGTPSGQPPFVLLDGVAINALSEVPEPATFMLIGLGLAGIPLARRTMKKRVG